MPLTKLNHTSSTPKVLYFPRDEWVFSHLGRVSQHPQFIHLDHPPKDVRFVYGWKDLSLRKVEVLYSIFHYLRFFVAYFREGCRKRISLHRIIKFLACRQARRLSPPTTVEFLPTFPLTSGFTPWLLEIEDSTTLFHPFLLNGNTEYVQPQMEPWFPLVNRQLEDSHCLGIISHVRSTIDGLNVLFKNSPRILNKLFYLPVPYLPPEPFDVDKKESATSVIWFLFTNSWHQYESNFPLRGGLLILEAFQRLLLKGHRNFHLILRTRIPNGLLTVFSALFNSNCVTVIDSFLEREALIRLFKESHVYLLPSARIHVHSLMEAAYFGNAIVTSDGWGISEYTLPNESTFVVPGFYGRVSWLDKVVGILRENYQPMRVPSLDMIERLQTLLQAILENPETIQERGRRGHEFVLRNYSLDRTNALFDQILTRAWTAIK